ncbi:hypothetical protein GWR56_13960 [Mucilaginibacter sp. 14171R-50]|uniref:hypothetical protein n=1 Tax=Mucilaginibacter sp. 14171R-50 TaxID=2703789 RepID=UPI00138C49B2|nr:hypothetical protein [Mucilaginibacter sp. 14171R-50]QHS56594.1 hypothetical protein GWR56_13960 [Mucilaginibacter sp. 14171R-50]
MYHRVALSVRSITAIFWLGFYMAISFMEAPLKFTAPGLSMAEGLQIGKIIFKSLNTCEWTFFLILIITCIVQKTTRMGFYLITAISLILVVETKWLLPILDHHANEIIKGGTVTDHNAHWLYILLEVIKVPVLLLIGIESGKMLWKKKPIKES